MQLGVVFPTTAIGVDPFDIERYAVAVEDAGYEHMVFYDHVVGAHPSVAREHWPSNAYSHESTFHEPLVTMAFLANATRSLGLATGVLVLPQRQTVLVAKQAAELDVLSRGRVRLGVGSGWNDIEYESLGMDYGDRGRRLGEQVELLRRLFTEPVVDFEGTYHRVRSAGLNPLPVQRPIPIWMGGMADAVIARVASHADGWFPWFASQPGQRSSTPPPRSLGTNAAREPRDVIDDLRRRMDAAGRDFDDLGIEVVLRPGGDDDDGAWAAQAVSWQDIGITHLAVNTARTAGSSSVDRHIELMLRFKDVMNRELDLPKQPTA